MSVAFEKHGNGDLEYFVPGNMRDTECTGISAVFTTRAGGVSGGNDKNSPVYSLNLGFKKKYDDSENVRKNYERIADSLGFSVNNIIYAQQKHTDNILVCDNKFFEDNKNNTLRLPDEYIYDAMITDIPGVLLTVRTADCVPVLFWDKENKAVGAAHCGWRGTLNRLQVKTALKMREIYGTSFNDLKISTGPCISKCCYEVSEEFYENFTDTLGERVKIYFEEKSDGKYMCDLKGINKMLLLDIVDEKNIEISGNCTYCEEDLFFSHRRQGEYRGTHAAFIGVR